MPDKPPSDFSSLPRYPGNEPEPSADPSTALEKEYGLVPWFRVSGVNSLALLAGFFCFPPLIWAVCIIALTGDIYYKRMDKDGKLARWSTANKIAAVILIVLNFLWVANWLYRRHLR